LDAVTGAAVQPTGCFYLDAEWDPANPPSTTQSPTLMWWNGRRWQTECTDRSSTAGLTCYL